MPLSGFDNQTRIDRWFGDELDSVSWFDQDLDFIEQVPETFTKTGVAIRAMVASGPKRVNGNDYVKSGMAVMGIAPGTVYVKTGAAVSARVASGADAVTFADTGLAVSSLAASGDAAVTSVETGLAVSALVASGGAARTFAETGMAVAARAASGGDVTTFAETGSAVAVFTGSGADAVTFVETVRAVLGDAIFAYVKTGTAVSARAASAADVHTAVETGLAVSPRVASGPKAMSGFTIYTKTGRAIMGIIPAGLYVKTGAAVSARTGSGADVVTFVEQSDGLEFPEPPSLEGDNPPQLTMTGGGTKVVTIIPAISKTGIAISGRVASGGDAKTSAETGTAVRALAAFGSKTITTTSGNTFSKTGTAFSARVGSGADATTFVETGGGGGGIGTPYGFGAYGSGSYGVSGGNDRLASGTRLMVYGETGKGILEREASGTRAVTPQKTGAAIVTMAGGGQKQYLQVIRYSKAGAAIISFNAGGGSAGSHRWLEPHTPTTLTLATMVATTITLTPKTVDTAPLLTPKAEDSH